MPNFTLTGEVWLYPGETAAWHFVTLPAKESALIKQFFGTERRGWGSVSVAVTLGSSIWQTSIFPDNKRAAYILPLKAAVRKKEKVKAGDRITFSLQIELQQ